MKAWGRKILVFLTALGTTLAAVFPASGCTGGCINCFQCAGLGGAAAVLMAIGAVGGKKQSSGQPMPPNRRTDDGLSVGCADKK